MIISKTAGPGIGLSDSDHITYIPFVRDSQNNVNASLLIKTSAIDTSIQFLCDWQYANHGFDTSSTGLDAKDVFHIFSKLEKLVFSHTKFIITDRRIFGSDSTNTIKVEMLEGNRNLSVSTGDLWTPVTICTPYRECCSCGCLGFKGSSSPSNSSGDICCYPVYGTICTTFWVEDGWTPVNGGGGGGSGSGSGGGSGSSGGSTPSNCQTGGGNLTQLLDSCASGWIPIEGSQPPYVCNYQMTQHEIDVFYQLNVEDNLSDQNQQNQDCKGTKAGGNIKMQGTKEHWLIQLDYVANNWLFGEMEFQIPFASITNPSNRGRADIANLHNGNIFEIKPNNTIGIQAGITEVQNYIDKANQFCNSTLPSFTTWNHGTYYTTTFLPTGIPNNYLKAEIVAPGVIGYSYVTTTNPVPAPVLVPAPVEDQFKELIERLKQNAPNIDQIIAEYLQQHPVLLAFIKATAIGAGVAIIVGTLLEDILTGGLGITDDWVSFMLARRIIRFALAL